MATGKDSPGTPHLLLRVVAIGLVSLATAGFTSHLQAQERRERPVIQQAPEVETLFREGLQTYRSGDYAAAYEIFSRLTDRRPPHQRITASWLMEGRSLYKLGRYQEAIAELRRFVGAFPASRYVDDAHYVIGNSYYRLGSYPQAVAEWLWVYENSDSPALVERCERLAGSVIENELSRDDLRTLRSQVKGERALGLLTLELALAEFRGGAPSRGISILKQYADEHPRSPFLSRIQEILENPDVHAAAVPRVGVVLPLTGFYSDQAMAMLRGINFARMQERQNDHMPLELEIRDSEGRIIPALRAAQELGEDPEVLAMIGELEPDLTAGIAAVASERQLPLLSPTSDEVGLAGLGPYVFQMNADLATKAAALARYAFDEMGLRTFATLSPTDDYGLAMTQAFTAEIDQRGGRIVSQTWYYEGAVDYRRQLKFIREAGLRLALEDSLHETGETWSKAAVDSLWDELNRAYRMASDDDLDMVESDEIPVRSIDAVFIPVFSSREIAFIAPQLATVRIETQILGGDYWNDPEVLRNRQIRPHVEGAVFVSGSYWSEEDPEYLRFRREYRLAIGTTPTKWDMFGYDSMGLLLTAIREGAQTREQVRETLAGIDSYRGVMGEISFDGNRRVNKKVYILRFEDGNIIRLK